jgi:hypothetical protein
MPNRLTVLAAVLLWGLWVPGAFAVQVSGLYQTEVSVAGQGPEERRRALRSALTQVLIKVSGQRGVTGNAGIEAALKDPARYVQQYRYRVVGDDTAPAAAHAQVLWAQFDRDAVNRLLRDSGLSVWGRERPAVLVWLAVEEGGRRRLLGSDEGGERVAALQGRAAARGLPLVLPLLDLEDQSRLRVTDVWGDFQDTILAASGRYASDAVLVARAYRVLPGLWEAHWTLLQGESAVAWTTQADVPGALLEEGVDHAADTLAAQFARPLEADVPGRLQLLVTDVNTLQDYARVFRYLASLDAVERVHTTRVGRGRVWFRLDASAGGDALARAIALGRTLRPVDTKEHWQYRLLP